MLLQVERLKEQADAKNDLRAALAKSDLQIRLYVEALGMIVDGHNTGLKSKGDLATIAHRALLTSPSTEKQKCEPPPDIGRDYYHEDL
jgi:hypothetical protein